MKIIIFSTTAVILATLGFWYFYTQNKKMEMQSALTINPMAPLKNDEFFKEPTVESFVSKFEGFSVACVQGKALSIYITIVSENLVAVASDKDGLKDPDNMTPITDLETEALKIILSRNHIALGNIGYKITTDTDIKYSLDKTASEDLKVWLVNKTLDENPIPQYE